MKNVNENCDIVNWFFMKKFQLLVEHVFPVLKITDHIARSEFQGRGSIHIHAILVAEGDVTPKDLELAIKATQYPDDSYILQVDESTDGTAEKIFQEKLKNHNNIISSRNKVCDFAANHIGLTTLHPNANPNEWPETSPHATDSQCLRSPFKDTYESKNFSQQYEHIVNLVQRHTCSPNYCLSYAHKDKETGEPKCRFQFPKDLHGFTAMTDDQNQITSISRKLVNDQKYNDPKTKDKEEESVAPKGASVVNGKICMIRNHHKIVQHIKEMPLIWGANTEAQVVTSWRQLLMYIVKYVMKAEKPSDAFIRIANELLQKEGEDVPVRKVFSKLLMNSIDRDKSRAECFLIALIGEYVQYSQKFQWVNLNGNKQLKASVNSENEPAMETVDWLHIYAEREENDQFKQLCTDYPSKFKWPYHPKLINLRTFVTYFTKNWKV